MEKIKAKSEKIIKKALMGIAKHEDWLSYQDDVYYDVKYGCQTYKNLYKIIINSKKDGPTGLLNAYNIVGGNY